MIERAERRLSAWNRWYLSNGGKLTLVQSILASILAYFMSLFMIPFLVALRIEKPQNDFLWKHVEEEFKYYLVEAWDNLCA